MRPFFIVILIGSLLAGCIKQVSPHFRNAGKILVVEGLLLTDSTPCKVTLSYSGLFNDNGAQLQEYINDATVYVKDGSGNSIQLINQLNGIYLSQGNSPIGKVNESYTLSVTLADGKSYSSLPEKIVAVPQNMEIDSIGLSDFNAIPLYPDLLGADVKIKFQDPGDQQNYYRWITSGYIPRKSKGSPCAPFDPYLCHQNCYQAFEDHGIYTYSDAATNGNEVRYKSILLSPYFITGEHFLDIKQLSMTQQASQFWQLYREQTFRTGTILDPLPSPLQGNIFNDNDSTELALGFFEASDVFEKKVILKPTIYNSFVLLYSGRYIPEGDCSISLPDASEATPSGWENAEIFSYDVN